MNHPLDEERVERAAMTIRATRGLYGKPTPSSLEVARAAISAYLGETHVVVARGKFHSFETGDRVHHIGRKEDGAVTVLDNGNVQVVFDVPAPSGARSIGIFDSNWFDTHPHWLIPLPHPST